MTRSIIMKDDMHLSEGIQSGYNVPGHRLGLFMFLPHAYFDYRNPRNFQLKCFNQTPLSRKFYHLKFKLHLWNKTFVHFAILMFGAFSLHGMDYLIQSVFFETGTRFIVLRVPLVKVAGKIRDLL